MDFIDRLNATLIFLGIGVGFAASPFILVFGSTFLYEVVKEKVFKIQPKPLEEDYGW